MTTHPFIAIFCPNCGACVNEPDLPEFRDGTEVTCGWCKQRHSITGVITCRNLATMSSHQYVAGMMVKMRNDLLKLRRRMTTVPAVDTFVDLPPFTAEEVEALVDAVQTRRKVAEDTGESAGIWWSLETALSEGLSSYSRLQAHQNPD